MPECPRDTARIETELLSTIVAIESILKIAIILEVEKLNDTKSCYKMQ